MNNTFDLKKIVLLALLGVVIVIVVVVAVMYVPSMGNKVPPLEGSGVSKESTLDLSSVRSVDINIPGTVKIIVSDENKLEMTMDDNFSSCITVTDEDRKLVIDQKACNGMQLYEMKPKAGISITIKASTVERIALSSSAEITAETKQTKEFEIFMTGSGNITAGIDTDKLNIRHSGLGNIKLTGRGFEQNIEITGKGNFNGENLIGNVGEVLVNNSGSILINTSEVLTIKGSGSGTVSYIGAPAITRTISGPVKVQPYQKK